MVQPLKQAKDNHCFFPSKLSACHRADIWVAGREAGIPVLTVQAD